MKKVNYKLSITSQGANAHFIVSYKGGRFSSLEKKRGKLANASQWDKIMALVPELEINIPRKINEFSTRGVQITKVNKSNTVTIYSLFMEAYYTFYEMRIEVPPKITAVDGKALKSIISHLKNISGNEEEALEIWRVILGNWDSIEGFYNKQMELKSINSNINTIIRQLKHGKGNNQNGFSANDYANDLTESF